MQSLAVKYRPQNFEEVVGQESIIDILSKQIETKSPIKIKIIVYSEIYEKLNRRNRLI